MADDEKPKRSAGHSMAMRALEEARENAKAKGQFTGRGRRDPVRSTVRRRKGGWTAAGADHWDPQSLGSLISKVAKKQGWDDQVVFGRMQTRWPEIIGEGNAAHVVPEKLEDGVLYCRASSTAWATQMRLYQKQTLQNIAKAFGPNIVRRMRINGPAAPSWRKGPLHVKGRGPRDTYG